MVLFIISLIALLYTLISNKRLATLTNVMIFALLMLSWGFMAILSIYKRKASSEELETTQFNTICNFFYGIHFFTKYTAMLLFVTKYQSTKPEIRKVLGKKNIVSHTKPTLIIMPILILLAIGCTFLVCLFNNTDFYESWISAASESVVCGVLTLMYFKYVSQIYTLIETVNLDLAPIKKNFCGNMSVLLFLLIITVSEAGIHYVIFGGNAPESSNTFLLLSITIQLCRFIVYILLFSLVYNLSKQGRTFEDLILH